MGNKLYERPQVLETFEMPRGLNLLVGGGSLREIYDYEEGGEMEED